MKLLTRNSDYAIRAVSYMAGRRGSIVSVPELVAATKVPRPFLRKILQLLNRDGLLRSQRGKAGGFTLLKSPGEIFLVDIMKIFQGPFKLNECLFKEDICPNSKRCALKKKIDEMEKYISSHLGSLTIKDVLER